MAAPTNFWRSFFAASASALVVVGTCGGGGGGCGGGSGSGSGGTTGGGTTGGGATGGGGSTTGGSAATQYVGTVILSDETTLGTFGPIVEFTNNASSAVCPGGTQTGNCCFEPPPSTSGGTPPTLFSAGTVTVTDDGSTIGTVGPVAGNYYALSSSPTMFNWKPGDTLGISAGGAVIDAFSASVTAPGVIAGFTPPTSITLASNWTASWTPDTRSGETVIVTLTATAGTKTVGEISCTVPDSAGSLSVQSGLLGNFASGDTASLAFVRYAGSSTPSGNVTVHLLAEETISATVSLK